MMKQLERGSSDVDWCEGNYDMSSLVAEFYNTISNLLFFIFPPLLIYLFRNYARQVTWQINIVWVLLVIVGMGSVYFHATLSLLGQLLDEIAILWVLMASIAIWYPKRLLPLVFKQSRKNFKLIVGGIAVLVSAMACLVPQANAFVLMLFGVPAFVLMIIELNRCDCIRTVRLGKRCGFIWLAAVTCWLNDKLFCEVWSDVSFPYLHCAWHILIFIAAYTGCVLFAFFDAKSEVPELMPVLKYWPYDSWDVAGVPYVTMKRVAAQPAARL